MYKSKNSSIFIQMIYNFACDFSYPMNPPVVRFLTKIIHPNVSRHGDVGIDIIQHNWSLVLTISKLLLSVQSLLTDPFTEVNIVIIENEIAKIHSAFQNRYIRRHFFIIRVLNSFYLLIGLHGTSFGTTL